MLGRGCCQAAVGEFLPGGGAGVALHGVQAPAQVPGDLPQAAALGEQVVRDRVVPPDSVCILPGRLRPGRLSGRPGFRAVSGSGFWFCEAGAVRGDAPVGG